MRVILFCMYFFVANSISAQININKLKDVASKAEEVINHRNLSSDEVAKGLKEALMVGVTNSTVNASKTGGFNYNLLIKIRFPKDAEKMKVALVKFGMKSQVDKFEYALNEAAENASDYAKEIFINSVKSMTIKDAVSLLKGDDNAATIYLKNRTSDDLYLKFKPVIRKSIEKVRLTKYWADLVEKYNSIPLTEEVNTDLDDYVTNQTINGLFILIGKEEKNIRNNPQARVTDILQRVFK